MSNFSLFSVIGIEIEYMLVDKDSLNIQPKSDLLLSQLAGKLVDEVSLGEIGVSNELVMHVIELKNDGPKPMSISLVDDFQSAIDKIALTLKNDNIILLPTAAHPWMNPLTETKRWPHANHDIYQCFDSIFNCKGHGWSNLQSMHLNFPFANDEEFFQLHNTIRLILPLLPALAASSPILDGKPSGLLDARLAYYARNQAKLPSITGEVIPDFSLSSLHYEQEILQPMYREISPYDPNKILQHEWLNSRGAIPKFERNAIEIRLLDTQECVEADIAIAHTVFAILQSWLEHSTAHLEKSCSTASLKHIFNLAIKDGFSTVVEDSELLSQWQLPKRTMTLRDVWSLLIERVSPKISMRSQRALEQILSHGNLSERILKACGGSYTHPQLKAIYSQLATCLKTNQLYLPL